MSFDESAVVARVRRVTLRELRVWVDEGWVRPAHGDTGPVFDELDIARVRLLCDLHKEMALPDDTIPVVLSLLDNLHATRRDLSHLVEAVERQPEAVREEIVKTCRDLQGGDAEDDQGG